LSITLVTTLAPFSNMLKVPILVLVMTLQLSLRDQERLKKR
jgi:hypothetical protein